MNRGGAVKRCKNARVGNFTVFLHLPDELRAYALYFEDAVAPDSANPVVTKPGVTD